MKGANFYRSAYLSDLAEIFDLRVLFTTRASEISNRHPSHFAAAHEQAFNAVYASGLTMASRKVAFGLRKAIGRKPDLALIGLLDDVVSLQVMGRFHRTSTPYILSLDGVGRRSRAIDMVFAPYVRRASGFMSPNAATDAMISELGGSAPITRYHLGSRRASEIDPRPTDVATKMELRKRLGLPTTLPTILSVGQTIGRKGFDTLIDSIALIDTPCSIVIVGGAATHELAKHVAQLPSRHRITFVPHADKSLLASYYRMADIFALATRGDSWGLVVTEALGHGLPVVTTTACGAGIELVDSTCGAIVPPEDFSALARVVGPLVDDDDLRARLATAAVARATTCTIEQMVERTVHAVRTFRDFATP